MKPEEINDLIEKYGLEGILGIYDLTIIEALDILDEHGYISLSHLHEAET